MSNKYIYLALSTQGNHQYNYLNDNAVMQAFIDAQKAAGYYKQKTKEVPQGVQLRISILQPWDI